jgi:retron-type reverse transcriptase
MKIGKKGRKKHKILLFVDFKRAFDTVDRHKLLQIINERIKDPQLVNMVTRLLLSQRIEMPDGLSYFF